MPGFIYRAKTWILLALSTCIALPILLSKQANTHPSSRSLSPNQTLIIITPHNETIRREFAEAFTHYWKKKTGKEVAIEWRTPGGTSEIRKIINSSFANAHKIGDQGIGIDVFFGGGDYEFNKQEQLGHLEPLSVFDSHPHWFTQNVLPETFSGERYYSAHKYWVGVCLSRFGICYNKDVLKRLGLSPPRQWKSLANPQYFGNIALADPSKSGSVARAFEMILQQSMQEAPSAQQGWLDGLHLIQAISANARYFTDSSTKIPHDVAMGNAAAGMALDYYGRSYEERLLTLHGSSRLVWIAPQGGTSMGADPIAILKGAPHHKLAEAFIVFCLSEKGQCLWNAKPHTPFGTRYRSLRRMPIRRDLYTKKHLNDFADPHNPYLETGDFFYDKQLTGHLFYAIQFTIKTLCLNCQEEMKYAWKMLKKHHFPPQATTTFYAPASFFAYDTLQKEVLPLLSQKDGIGLSRLTTKLTIACKKHYIHAAHLAKKGL